MKSAETLPRISPLVETWFPHTVINLFGSIDDYEKQKFYDFGHRRFG